VSAKKIKDLALDLALQAGEIPVPQIPQTPGHPLEAGHRSRDRGGPGLRKTDRGRHTPRLSRPRHHRRGGRAQGHDSVGAPITWFIDPLDGTVNYSHGCPCSRQHRRLGAWPQGAQIQTARRGAWRPLGRGGARAMDARDLTAVRGAGPFVTDAASMSLPRQSPSRPCWPAVFAYTPPQAGEQPRMDGSHPRLPGPAPHGFGRLDLCFTAAGRFDGFWEYGLKSWDVAAGGLILEEAGAGSRISKAFRTR